MFFCFFFFFFKQKTAYEMRISDWSSDVCSSDLRAEGVYKGRKNNVDDDGIRRRLAAGASKARVARDLKVSRMTVYRALDIIPSQTKLPEKPPTASIALHLIIENFNKRGRGRKPARERIEAMLERD